MSKLDDALKLLREERSRIDSAIAALTGGDHKPVTKVAATTAPAPKKRRLSAAARKRIADAQKKRWAAQKAKAAK